jgi:hypothetical protein
MEIIKSKPGLSKFYGKAPTEIQGYFWELPKLLEHSFSLDVLLAYMFSRVEFAHVNCLYCGVVKLHKVDAGLARRAVQQTHMTRDGFREKFLIVYGKEIVASASGLLARAEAIRDMVLHGKGASDEQKRNAIAHVIEYAKELNGHVLGLGGPAPFGDLRGFAGAAQRHSTTTSRWILKGMGFQLK